MSSGDRGSNRYQEILDLYEAFEQSVPQQGNGYISSTSDFQPNISNNGHEGISSASRLFAAFLDTQRPSPSRHLFHVPSVADVMLSRPSYSSADAVSVNTSSSSSTACVYLCGNSLGLQPVETRTLINQELDVWAKRGVIGHFDHPHNRPWALIDNCVLDESARIVGKYGQLVGGTE